MNKYLKNKNVFIVAVLILALLAVGAGVLLSGGDPKDDGQPVYVGSLQITEICTKNESVLADNTGKYWDYIELHAPETPINLKGYTMTDGKVTSGPLGDITIEAGGYRVLFLDKKTTGFALNASGGDTIQLKDPNGAIAAQVNTTALGEDQVMLLIDGGYVVSYDASPNFPNTPEGLAAFREGKAQTDPRLVISEVLTANERTLPDESGVFSDVIELHNVSEEAVYLGNYFLADDKDQRFAYRLPDMLLEAGGYLLIYCDGENYIAADGKIHANFGLSRGESLYLTDGAGCFQEVACPGIGEDTSWQLLVSGEFAAGVPSLGFANTPEGTEQAAAQRTNAQSDLVISEVVMSNSGMPYGGVISDYVEIINRSQRSVSTEGWYLSDGADPYDYPLPVQTLQPGECLVIQCDTAGTGFGLSRGETLMLTGPDYRHAPLITCTETEPGLSISLADTGEDLAYTTAPVSLGFENTEPGRETYLLAQQPKGLMISEVMTSNYSYLRGPYGAVCDWLELYNAGSEAVDLSAYSVTDNAKFPAEFKLPQRTLAPGEYCVIMLTTDPGKAKAGYDVIAMELSSRGEWLYLYRDGLVEDFVLIPPLEADDAYGRSSGSSFFSQLEKPTPGKPNTETAAVSSDPVAVTAPGKYDGVEYVDVELSAPGKIYYTTNCTTPNRYCREYTGPIRITETTVLRVISYEEGKSGSNVVDLLYAVNEGDSLPIVSLVAEPRYFWSDEVGIYADGANPGPFPYDGANYNQNWERPGSVSLYENDGSGFSQKCGLTIFGGSSRLMAKKSLACMFRKSYGKGQLDYPVFGEDSLPYYEALVLRAGGQESNITRFKDEMITSFAGEQLGLPVQNYRPVVLYLNGEYWGIYFIREKINEHYVSGHFGLDADAVEMCRWTGKNSARYVELRNFAQNRNMANQDNYERVVSQIDVENYTDYMASVIWIGDRDAGNVRFFSAPGYPWTWVFFDTDKSFVEPEYNTLSWFTRSDLTLDTSCRTFMVRLMNNPEYRDYFLRRLAWHIREVWTEDKLIPHIDSFYRMLQADMEKECTRWRTRYSDWEKQVEQLREFARGRSEYLVKHIQRRYGLTEEQMVEYGFIAE